MNQNILNALDTLLATTRWDKLILLTPVDTWYPFLADRVSIPIITVSVEEGTIEKRLPDLRKADYAIHLPCAVTGAEDLFNLSVALAMTEGALSYKDSVIFLGATLNNNAHFILVTQIAETSLSELHRVIADPACLIQMS